MDKHAVAAAYAKFKAHFHNPAIQENIRNSKEEQYQEGFLNDLFVNILGYTKNPHSGFNITTEYKNVKDSKKADGAILLAKEHAPSPNTSSSVVIAVIELKGTETTDLNKIENQAFGYKNNQPDCVYIITSNFEKLRFYIDNAIEHLEFNLFTLNEKDFDLLWLCLSYASISKGLPKRIKDESISQEDAITKNLYNDYSLFKRELHRNLVELNPQDDALTLFKKSQKLLDRFLFLFFAEDRQLLPPNSVRLILDDWRDLQDRDVEIPLYARFKKYFEYLNTGFKGKRYDVFAYNGGLFKTDVLLDALKIDDELLYRHTLKLSEYDFVSEVDVNILGHIFENSLNELDEIKAQLDGQEIDKTKTKRKKDGVFYTPKYITKYIVDNTVGKLYTDKKAELQLNEEYYITDRKRTKKTIQPLFDKLTTYRNWLLQLTICDPACGSGAFLNQVLDYLITEHRTIDELQAKLFGDAMVFTDTEKSILENNLFGVDINEESVEIAKLSLWLRTAQPNRRLNDLNNNIKCGNSLIDDPAVAGDKAFNWQKEFPQVFIEKAKKAWHITTATHNSRYSQRMFDNFVKLGKPVWLSAEEEEIVTSVVADIAKKDNLNILAYNICGDHMHLVLICEDEELASIVQKIESMSARACNIAMGRTIPVATSKMGQHAASPPVSEYTLADDATSGTREHAPSAENAYAQGRGTTQNHLWTQKFGQKEIMTEEHLNNTIKYIQNNRIKHGLPELAFKGASSIVADFCCTVEHAFRTEYKGGFDVVIGNPPYGAFLRKKEKEYLKQNYSIAEYNYDTYNFFFELSIILLKRNGFLGFITPNTFLVIENGVQLRKLLFEQNRVIKLYETFNVFPDAVVEPIITILQKSNSQADNSFDVFLESRDKSEFQKLNFTHDYVLLKDTLIFNYRATEHERRLFQKISVESEHLSNFANIKAGVKPYEVGKGNPPQTDKTIKEKPFNSFSFEDKDWYKLIRGTQIARYNISWDGEYLKYGEWLAAARNPDIFFKSKIVIRRTDDKLLCAYDNEKFVGLNSIHCLQLFTEELNYNYILTIINSNLCNWIFRHENFHMVGKPLAEVKIIFVERLPIIKISSELQQPFIEKADQMLSLNKKLQEISGKFQHTIKRKFFSTAKETVEHAPLAPLPLQNKLQNWYQLTYKEFIAELAKKKVKLSLSEEAEWEAYFLQECAIAQQLKAQIDKTDKDIDRMVYQLYELTEDDIRIVEGL